MTARKGVTAQLAKIEMRRRLTLIGAMLLHKGEVDGMLCGTWGTTAMHLHYIDQVIGRRAGVEHLRLHERADPARAPGHPGRHPRQLRPDRRAARRDHGHGGRGDDALRHCSPRRRCCRTRNFGTSNQPSAVKMRDALALLQRAAPWLEVDGEMHGDAALDAALPRPS